nr:aldo/keto reductase [Acanthopleuribacter pedis]
MRVSELCLGTMTFGEDWQFGADKDTSCDMLRAFCEVGGNFIDTADVYTMGSSERYLGEFINHDRDFFVVSSKYSLSTRHDDPNGGGNSRKNMRRAVEASLQRLQTDHLDVFWLHAWDGGTPLEEIMRGLDDLVSAGKVLYIGVSDTPAWVVSRANMMAELRGWSQFIGLQAEYNLAARTPERDLLPMAEALNLGVLAWAPLAGGVLTGKYVAAEEGVSVEDSLRGVRMNGHRLGEQQLAVARTLVEVAREVEVAPAPVALAWLRQRPTPVIPIVAGRTLDQLKQNLDCLSVTLSEDQLERLDRVSAVPLGFPHEFLQSNPLRRALFGYCDELIDPPAGLRT